MQKITYDEININKDLFISHLGPPLSCGPLPSVIYFAISSENNLLEDPFNQPAIFLSNNNIRVFSITLPYHNKNSNLKNSLNLWAKDIENNIDIISMFIEKAKKALNYLISNNLSTPTKIATMGLSRGAYISMHLAASTPLINIFLGFAPLIDLSYIKEFKETKKSALLKNLHYEKLIPSLLNKKTRLYIGDNDNRVGTKNAFSFIEKINQAECNKNIKKTTSEIVISPSTGIHGHGTSKETFEKGCLWLKNNLLINKDII